MSNSMFLLWLGFTLGLGIAALLSFAATWLSRHPESQITRWLENIFRSLGT